MLQKIVVSFDATAASVDAARWAIGLLAPVGGKVVLVHTVDDRAGSESDEAALVHPDGDRVRDVARSVTPVDAAQLHVDLRSRSGDPDAELAAVCREVGADLVVLGVEHTDDVGARLAFGLLERAGAALAAVPAGTSPPARGTAWVVGVDGGAGAHDALLWSEAAAELTDGRLHPVLAYDPAADTFPHPAEPAWTYPGELDAREQLAQRGGRRTEVLRTAPGAPPDVLRAAAAKLDVPAVLVAGAGGGRLRRAGRIGLSKTTSTLLERSPQVVVVVPPFEDAGTEGPTTQAPELVEQDRRHSTVRAADVGQASDLVAAAERAGEEAGALHIDGASLAPSVGDVQRNDRANIAAAARPTAATGVAGAVVGGAVLLAVCLVAGAGSLLTVLLSVVGVIGGLVLGALAGLYRSITINRDVVDLRGQEQTTGVQVRESTDRETGRPVAR